MDKLKYIKLENEDGSYSSSIPLAVDANYVDINGSTLIQELDKKVSQNKFNDLELQVSKMTNSVPRAVSSISEMVDTSKIYINTTNGHWYWYNGVDWEDGGIYQSAGIAEKSIDTNQALFYEEYNILPKYDWIENKVIDHSGLIQSYNSGCYNPKYIAVDAIQPLYIVSSDKRQSSTLKVMQYDENKTFLRYADLGVTNNKITLHSSCQYVRFTYWNEKFSVFPDNFPIVLSYNNFMNLHSFYTLAKTKDEYKDKVETTDVIINDKVHFSSLIYAWGLDVDKTKTKYNAINDISIVGKITKTTAYIGTYLNFKNLNKNDTIYVFVQTDGTISNINLLRNGDSTVASLRKVTNNFYVGKVDDNVLQYQDQLRCVVRFDGTTPSDLDFMVQIKMNINSLATTLNEYLDIHNDKKNFIILGDSITHMTGTANWVTHMQSKINATVIANVAVDGAHLKDYDDTPSYDGNPTYDSHNNVLGNQVQKIINNNYDAPDIIMIAIGTNGGISATAEQIYDTYYDSNQTLIPVESVDRKTDAGAFRWCNEKLHDKYPNAKIIWCTPIQGTARNTQAIIGWGDALKRLCAWGSNYCCDTEKCGISITNASEYLYDGLHPNDAGAKMIGYYNATEVSKFMNK